LSGREKGVQGGGRRVYEGGRRVALEIESFLGPVKWHRADRRVPFGAPF
jgi:hypothetical protein